MRLAGRGGLSGNCALRKWRDHYEVTGKSIPLKTLSDSLDRTEAARRDGVAGRGRLASPAASSQGPRQGLRELLQPEHEGEAAPVQEQETGHAPVPDPREGQRSPTARSAAPKVGWGLDLPTAPVDLPIKSATFKRDALGIGT